MCCQVVPLSPLHSIAPEKRGRSTRWATARLAGRSGFRTRVGELLASMIPGGFTRGLSITFTLSRGGDVMRMTPAAINKSRMIAGVTTPIARCALTGNRARR